MQNKNLGGRPRNKFKVKIPKKSSSKSATVDLSTRAKAEEFVEKKLTHLASALSNLAHHHEQIMAALRDALTHQTAETGEIDGGLLTRLEAREKEYRQVLADEGDLCDKLMKRFKLLSENLDQVEDENDDPRFAPVTFEINLSPPGSDE